jgi:catechol 2,3-dioxygenase
MSMRGVLRLGEVQLFVVDMAEAKTHYGTRMGLHEMMTDAEGLVYYKAWDEHDHHSVVLRESDRAGLQHLAFKVYDDATLDSLAGRIREFGLPVEEVRAGTYPKSGRRIRFHLPTGHETHLYAEKEYVGNGLGLHNPGTIPDEGVARGFHINGLDHCLLAGPDIERTAKLFIEVFEFNLSEQLLDKPGGTPLLNFVSCSSRAHDVAFLLQPRPALLHHISFRLDSEHDHVLAGDLMGKYRINVESNDRHGITRGKTIYFFDPSGNRNEVFYDGYTYYPDRPTLTWDAESDLSGAVFAQTRKVPESFLIAFS